MKKIRLLGLLAASALLVMQGCKKTETANKSTSHVAKLPSLRTNWVEGTSADPWIITYGGNYYLIYNKDWNNITVRIASSIQALADAPDQVLYSASQNPAGMNHGVGGGSWLYRDAGTGKWYLYGWGDDGSVLHAHPFVAESTTGPSGPFTYKATFTSPNDGIDNYGYCASPMFINGQLYLTQTDNGKIYLAKMTNPWTINTSAPSDPSGWNLISAPNTGSGTWECADGRCVNEGGTVVVKNGYAYILFMAGGYESPDYCVGMLTANVTANLLSQSSWTKSASPVYVKNPSAGVYGPTLNWFKSPDGTEDWAVGHVANSSAINAPRFLQYKRVTWNTSVTPNIPIFGQPYALDSYPSPLFPSGDPGYATSASGVYEAENTSVAVKTGCVSTASTSASGGSYVSGIDASGDKITFTVNVPASPGAGTYLLKVYYSNTSATTAIQNLSINASTSELSINYPQTGSIAGSFPDDKYAVIGVKLNSGSNTLAFKWTSGTVNIDKIQLNVNKATDGIGAASQGSGLVNAFAVKASTNEVWSKSYSGGSWAASWIKTGTHPTITSLIGAPAAVSRNPAKIDVVSLARNGELWTTWWDVNWNTWYTLGKPPVGISMVGASVASYASNKVDVFVLGGDRQIWSRAFTDGGSWIGWFKPRDAVNMKFVSAPAVVSRAANTLDMFAVGADGAIWNTSWDGTTWADWSYIGPPPGGANSNPVVTSSSSWDISLYVRGAYGQVFQKKWVLGTWSDWEQIPQTGMSSTIVSPGATSQKVSGTPFDIFGQLGTTVYTNRYTTAWSGWSSIGAP